MLFQIIELLAVFSAGIFGILLARQKGMDLVGVISVALIASFGGGTLRDLFLGRRPLFWIEQGHYPLLIFSMACISILIPKMPRETSKYLELPDALGMGLFAAIGTKYSLDAQTTWFVASLLGVITGTFGGVMADIVCNEVPRLFLPKTPLYATCAFLGAWNFILLRYLGVNESSAIIACMITAVTLRMLAINYNLQLPAKQDDPGPL